MNVTASGILLSFIVLAMLTVGAAAAVVHFPRFTVSAGEFWRPEQTESDAIRQVRSERLNALPDEKVWAEASQAFMQSNLVSVERKAGSADKAELEAWLTTRWGTIAREFGESHGAAAYMALGTYLSLHFRDALSAVSAEVARSGVSVQEWLADAGSTNVAGLATLRALSGTFIETAAGAGLVQRGRPMDDVELDVATLLFLDNWVRWGGEEAAKLFPTIEEKTLVLRWKVEAGKHLSAPRKLHLLDVLEHIAPSYPADYVRGVLLVRENRYDEAASFFLDCLETGTMASEARDWLLFLRRQ